MKSCNIEFKVAADKPPTDQIISEQLITGLLVICCFKSWTESVCKRDPEQLAGPFKIFCSMPTCQIA